MSGSVLGQGLSSFDGGPLPEFCSAPPADLLDPDLVRALCELTAEQREVVALRFVADLSIDAVATLTGRSPGAVKALQHRALATPGRAARRRRQPADLYRHRLTSEGSSRPHQECRTGIFREPRCLAFR